MSYPPTKQCPYCPKVFKSSSSLTGHIARHNQAGSRVNRLASGSDVTQQEVQADGSKLIWMRPVRLEHAGEVAQGKLYTHANLELTLHDRSYSVLSAGTSSRYGQSGGSSSSGVGPSFLNSSARVSQPHRPMGENVALPLDAY